MILYAARWTFTALFGGVLASLFMVATLCVALFCITGALAQGLWRSARG